MADLPPDSHPGGWGKGLLLHLRAYRLHVA